MAQLELEVKLFQLVRGLLTSMVDEIPSEDFQRLPAGGGNSPNWILGHLTIANGFGLMTLGQPSERAESMMPMYGPGSKPTEEMAELLSKEELVQAFHELADQFVAAVEGATPDQLAAPREGPLLQEQLPTVGDMTGHLLTTHFALHIGQLSAWRRAQGMDPVIKF